MGQLGACDNPRELVSAAAPVLTPETLHLNTFNSASAFSSQNRMSISRYIVVAVVRCSCACSRLPVRRDYNANTATRRRASCILIADLLISYGEGSTSPARCGGCGGHGRRRAESTERIQQPHGGVGRVGRARYSMIWSARASTDGGIVSASAFAVLALITSSNFVGCSTGRSAGLAPLRILSTKAADRREASVTLDA